MISPLQASFPACLCGFVVAKNLFPAKFLYRMKVSINQVKLNRVGLNTAQVRGIRLSSAVADSGHKVDFHFSDSLVDCWNFGGKNNFDIDRATVTGLLGNVLTAYDFEWKLMSGYGGYNENYLTYSKAANVFVTNDHSITIMNFVQPNVYTVYKSNINHIKATRIKVTGLTATDQLAYYYSPKGEMMAIFPIPEDGEYDLPESFQSISGINVYNVGFIVRKALTKNVTIKQIPLYEGAIVTDGVNDYLKLDKTGYKVGTVIFKHTPIKTGDSVRYVFNINTTSVYACYRIDSTFANNFNRYKTIEDYTVGFITTPRLAETPLIIGCHSSLKEFLSMALYSIAIYDRALSDQEVQEVINFMDKANKL